MKRYINSLFFLLTVCIVAGCSDGDGDTSAAPVAASAPQAAAVPAEIETHAEKAAPAAPPAETKPAAPKIAPVALSSEQQINRFKQWDQKLQFLKTNFSQTTHYDGVQINRSQGTLSYDKAHQLLRLDILNEDGMKEQSAVTNKKKIIILDETSKPVTTLSWKEWQQGQPNQALFDFGNYTALLERHNVRQEEPFVLVLTPKEGEEYTLYVTLSKQDYFPVRLKIVSDLMVTQADLTDTQKNKPLDKAIFGGFFDDDLSK